MTLKDWFAEQYNGSGSDTTRKNRWHQRIVKKNENLHKELEFTISSTHRNGQNKSRRILNKEAVTLLP